MSRDKDWDEIDWRSCPARHGIWCDSEKYSVVGRCQMDSCRALKDEVKSEMGNNR